MKGRQDALCGAAEIILEVERLGQNRLDRASVGLVEIEPNTVAIVPGRVELVADLRSVREAALATGLESLRGYLTQTSTRRGLQCSEAEVERSAPVTFSPKIVSAIVRAADSIGEEAVRLASGANHDAGRLAAVAPAGMIFVPSRDGRSHSPAEYTSPEHCQVGAIVLGLASREVADTLEKTAGLLGSKAR
jgi:N-carbamoyl-L-amino-acid hydrolase